MFSTSPPTLVYPEPEDGVTRLIRTTRSVKVLAVHKDWVCRHCMASSDPQADRSTTADSNRAVLEDSRIDVKVKLAGLWTAFMFLYVYVDLFGFFRPGTIEQILTGKIFVFEISPLFIFIALLTVTIPGLMIFLSLALPARVNRWTNIVLAVLYIPYSLFNLLDAGAWIHYYFGAGVEVALLALVLWYAWNWPRTPVDATQRAETNDRKAVQPDL